MGGIDAPAPKLSEEEVFARVIAAGKNCALPKVHTIWVVNNPSPSTLFYRDRSDLDNICYAIPVGHLTRFPFSPFIMERNQTTFYAYQDKEAAIKDAQQRLDKPGRYRRG